MVTKGIVLGHKISTSRSEVDQAKVYVIKTLFPPTTVKEIKSFLGHTGFYMRFIRDFSKISRPLCRLLENDANFDFDESHRFKFEEIKSRFVTASIMATPDWNKEFEIMCDASDYVMGVVLGKIIEKYSWPFTMLAKPSMRHQRTTLPQKMRRWQWCLLVKNSGLTYWDPMLSHTLIMLQLNI